VVAFFRGQVGHVAGWGDKNLRMLDHFQMGPNLVRGFAPSGIGPRDLTPGTFNDALGGAMYWGASIEAQVPLYIFPKEVGIKFAAFADAGSLWDYQGPISRASTNEFLQCAAGPGTPGTKTVSSGLPPPFGPACYGDANIIRSSVGVGLIWDSPFGPLRFDYSIPITKAGYDRVQEFRFGGGTKF
jgi:outer membrane protein insertion porin family